MTITVKVKPKELTRELVSKLGELFRQDEEVTLIVNDELDETEYLLSNPANRNHLLEALTETAEQNNTTFTVEEFNELYHKLSK